MAQQFERIRFQLALAIALDGQQHGVGQAGHPPLAEGQPESADLEIMGNFDMKKWAKIGN